MRLWTVRLAKGLGSLLGAVALALVLWSLVPAGTRAIPGEHAVAEIRRIELGGFPQAVLLRGVDRRNPVLLYVHGGPGSAQLPVARLYSGELEKHFVVAHWDQRGAGASCAGVDWSRLSLERIVADTIELAEALGGEDRIFLLGHSWGSLVGALAVQRRPDLFYAYVGLGQLVERDRQERISYDWVVEQARRAGDADALAALATIEPPYSSQREFALQRRWLGKYHGDVYATERAREVWPAVLFGREYTLATRLRYKPCFDRSLEVLLPDRLHVDLLTGVPRLDVPVFLFVGRHDYNTPWALAEEWASRLEAPHVELVWFEDAGHLIPLEAPEAFQARLLEKLLPLVPRGSARPLSPSG
ncbi:MAG: alpha/beta hydrolase [Deltaproteobacteria bacterium]|nr:MAG: alpha/beta hydrolase [Deltaproteobacteria bacterium]